MPKPEDSYMNRLRRDAAADTRYTLTYSNGRHLLRFCGTYIGTYKFHATAVQVRLEHYIRLFAAKEK